MGRGCAGRCPMPQLSLSLLLILVFSSWALLGATATGAVAGCPGCARPKPADSIRLEAIGMQILKKLGFKSKPQIKRTIPREVVLASLSKAGELPSSQFQQQEPSMYSSSQSSHYYSSSSTAYQSSSSSSHSSTQDDSDYDDFYGSTSEIITFAEQDREPRGSNTSVPSFKESRDRRI